MENAKIAKKLVTIMTDCAHILKNGVNDYHKYKYVTAEDVLQKVNESLTKNKISSFVEPEILEFRDVTNLKGNTEHLATVKVVINLVDSESGEIIQFVGMGSGQDAADKAIMKAQTAAIKYAYMLSLCIATGDDPEADIKTDMNSFVAPQNAEQKQRYSSDKPKCNVKTGSINKIVTCADCGGIINSDKVVDYSVKRYGRPLCMNCQKIAMQAA